TVRMPRVDRKNAMPTFGALAPGPDEGSLPAPARSLRLFLCVSDRNTIGPRSRGGPSGVGVGGRRTRVGARRRRCVSGRHRGRDGRVGVGKRRVWREGVAGAERRGQRVLSCRPVEAEIALPFAALGDLLDGVGDDVFAPLPGPQREALEAALLRTEVHGGPLLGRAVAVALLAVIRGLSAHGELVVAIDDLQWLDTPSADALAFAGRRLQAEPIGFFLARRAGTGAEFPLGLDSALDSSRISRLALDPLDRHALDRLLRTRLGTQFLSPALAELQRVSGGNPFFALELGRAWQARNAPLVAGDALPVPSTLQELLSDRLAGLSAEAGEVVLVVSAGSRPTVELVATAAGRERGIAAVEEAAAAGIVEVAGDRVIFTHPLLASVVYAEVPPSKRRDLHWRLAEIVGDRDERGRQLALAAAGPDPQVAAELDEAARRAGPRRGAQRGGALGARTPAHSPRRPRRLDTRVRCRGLPLRIRRHQPCARPARGRRRPAATRTRSCPRADPARLDPGGGRRLPHRRRPLSRCARGGRRGSGGAHRDRTGAGMERSRDR